MVEHGNRESRRRPVAVITDSAASVPDEFRTRSPAFVVPMRLHIGGATFRDDEDISSAEFYGMLRRSGEAASTSAPTPADFIRAYEAASRVAESAICVTVAESFSASGSAARRGLESFRAEGGMTDIRIVDSRSAAAGQGLVAWEALKAADGGHDIAEVEARATTVRDGVRVLAYVDTLRYLWKGGRVPGIAHLGASLLKLKPVFEMRQSRVSSVARPRTAQRALRRLVELAEERVGDSPTRVMVMHADAEERAARLSEALRGRLNCVEIHITQATPVMGAHIGPGMVGVGFWADT